MAWTLVGLGNPGSEYAKTRHNAGRITLAAFVEAQSLGEWKENRTIPAQIARGSVGKSLVVCVLPDTFMNKSGAAVLPYVKSVKAAEKMIVLYDDLDLPLGKIKISFDRGSGGHKGIESIARALKTKAFWRLRIGVSPITASGKLRKPSGEKEVLDFILGGFSPSELAVLKNIGTKSSRVLEMLLTDGPLKAMNECNTG